MSRNDNRDSLHILKTTSLGHLSHPEIPNFSIGGASPFTIEVWICTMEDTDGVLYGQKGGFSLSIEDGIPMFRQEGFCSLAAPKAWKFAGNRAVFLTIRYDGSKLTLFLGGLQVAQTVATALTTPPLGRYNIGQDFSGGTRMVRVLSKALPDDEILSHNLQLPIVNTDCVFQTDFSTRQFKDVSKNALPLGSVGDDVRCTMLTACTLFNGLGMYKRQQKVAIGVKHTVLCKFYPSDVVAGSEQILWDMATTQSLLSLELVRKDDHSFQIRVNKEGQKVLDSSFFVVPQMWHDVALVLTDGKALLYLDGVAAGSGDYVSTDEEANVVIGSAYTAGSGIYQGFYGMLAYCAQFSTALSATDVAVYADCPPYIFAPSIASLIIFSLDVPIEMYDASALGLYGSASFALIADTTALDTPEGIPLNIPQEDDPTWGTLSDSDKWDLETVAKITTASVGALMGYKAVTSTQLLRRTARAAQLTYNNVGNAVQRTVGTPTRTQVHNYTRLTATTAGTPMVVEGTGFFSFFTWGAAQSFIAKYWAEIVGVAVLIAATTIAISIIVIEAQKERPEEKKPEDKDQLRVESICWNHNGNSKTGSIHFHKGSDVSPTTMEFVPVNGQIVGSCILIPKLINEAYLEVKLRYTSTKSNIYTGSLSVEEIATNPILGAFTATNFTVNSGATCTVQVPFVRGKISENSCEKHKLVFSLSSKGDFLINHHADVYTLPNKPIAPWIAPEEEYKAATNNYVRVEFLDMFLQQPVSTTNTPTDIRQHVVEVLNASGFKYDTGGASHYTEDSKENFKLSKFLRDFDALSDTPASINCSDCATVVSSFCAVVGVDLPMAIFVGKPGDNKFGCNRIQAIGYDVWRFPFQVDEKASEGNFSYHQVNVDISATNQRLSATTPIYDACLKVDGGPYPSFLKRNKAPLLPIALVAQEVEKPIVNVPEADAYNGQFYRERLVRNNQECGFWQFILRVTAISLDVDTLHPVMKADAMPKLHRVFSVMESYGLIESNGPAVEARWPLDMDEDTIQDEGANFIERKILWQGQTYRILHSWQVENRSTELLLGMRLSTISTFLKEEQETEIGERCFVSLERNYLFSRQGQVFYVYPMDPSQNARTLAKAIDQALIDT